MILITAGKEKEMCRVMHFPLDPCKFPTKQEQLTAREMAVLKMIP